MSLLDKKMLDDKNKDQLTDEVMFQQQKSYFICESINLALWEYDTKTKLLSHQRKLGGKWSDNNLDIADYKNTMIGWGIIHPDDIELFNKYCDDMDNGKDNFTYDIRSITDSGEYSWLRYTGRTIRDKDQKIIKVIGTTTNISEQKKEKTSLLEKASHDPLTGLLNKAATKNAIIECLKDVSLETSHCLAIIDIDDFKYINDSYGHHYGDEVLQKISLNLKNIFADDIVGRVGGDEFFVLKKNIKSSVEAENTAITICETARAISLKNEKCMGTSVGVSVFPNDATNYDDLYLCADSALYAAKQNGKNGYCLYKKCMKHDRMNIPERKHTDSVYQQNDKSGLDQYVLNYVLDILSKKNSVKTHIENVSDFLGEYYGLNRVFICTCSKDSDMLSIPFYWSDNSVSGSAEETEKKLNQLRASFEKYARESTACIVRDINRNLSGAPQAETDIYKSMNIKAFLRINMYMEDQTFTFAEFDDCSQKREFSDGIIATVCYASKIISAYLSNTYKINNNQTLINQNISNELFANMVDGYMYIVDPQTYEIKYINESTRKKYGITAKSGKCYSVLCGKDRPCSICFAGKGTRDYGEIGGLYKTYETLHVKAKEFMLPAENRKLYAICAGQSYRYRNKIIATDRICNDESMEDFMINASKILEKNPDGKYAILYIRLETYNDILLQFGRSYTERLLQMFMKMRNLTSGGELFSHVCNGDFVMMLRYETPEKLYERKGMINQAVKSIPETETERRLCSFSFGVVFTDVYKRQTVAEYVDIAYSNIIAQKNNFGSDTSYYYQLDLYILVIRCRKLAENLSSAVAAGEFLIRSSPVRSLKTDKIMYMEIRYFWLKDSNPLVSENDFSMFIDSSKQLYILTSLKISLICKYIRKNLDKLENKFVSIPVSCKEALEKDYVVTAENVMKCYNVPAEMIDFQVDSKLMRLDMDHFIDFRNNIEKIGSTCSLSGLTQDNIPFNILRLFSFRTLKFDPVITDNQEEYRNDYLEVYRKLLNTVSENNSAVSFYSLDQFDEKMLSILRQSDSTGYVLHNGWT